MRTPAARAELARPAQPRVASAEVVEIPVLAGVQGWSGHADPVSRVGRHIHKERCIIKWTPECRPVCCIPRPPKAVDIKRFGGPLSVSDSNLRPWLYTFISAPNTPY